MSINWAQLNERKQPIPINNEVIVKSEPNAEVSLSYNPPETNQAPSAKGKAKANTLKATGTVYVTDQRVSWFAFWFRLSYTVPHNTLHFPPLACFSWSLSHQHSANQVPSIRSLCNTYPSCRYSISSRILDPTSSPSTSSPPLAVA